MHLGIQGRVRRSYLRLLAVDAEAGGLAVLPMWAISRGASVWLMDLEPYECCRVVGLVKRLKVDPANGHLDATVTDGTGEVVARWSIRRPTPELAMVPGRAVALEGVATVGDDGRLILQEPDFQTIPLPDVA